MDNNDIIQMYWDRNEQAIKATSEKYIHYCKTIARNIFVCRYWYADSVPDITKDYGMLQGTVSKTLERTRKQLKKFLTERGFEL